MKKRRPIVILVALQVLAVFLYACAEKAVDSTNPPGGVDGIPEDIVEPIAFDANAGGIDVKYRKDDVELYLMWSINPKSICTFNDVLHVCIPNVGVEDVTTSTPFQLFAGDVAVSNTLGGFANMLHVNLSQAAATWNAGDEIKVTLPASVGSSDGGVTFGSPYSFKFQVQREDVSKPTFVSWADPSNPPRMCGAPGSGLAEFPPHGLLGWDLSKPLARFPFVVEEKGIPGSSEVLPTIYGLPLSDILRDESGDPYLPGSSTSVRLLPPDGRALDPDALYYFEVPSEDLLMDGPPFMAEPPAQDASGAALRLQLGALPRTLTACFRAGGLRIDSPTGIPRRPENPASPTLPANFTVSGIVPVTNSDLGFPLRIHLASTSGPVIGATSLPATLPAGGAGFLPFSVAVSTTALAPMTGPIRLDAEITFQQFTPPDVVFDEVVVNIDNRSPTTTIQSVSTSGATATFTFVSSETGSTFSCTVDTQPALGCASPFKTAALMNGPHTFNVRATDAAGNVDPQGANASFSTFVVPPTTEILSAPPPFTMSTSATFAFTSTSASVAFFQCSVDGAPFSGSCVSPKTYAPISEGHHSFSVRAVDGYGNVDPTPPTRTWTVDETPPLLTLVSPADGSMTSSTSLTATISVSEALSGPVLVSDSNIFPPGTQLSPGNVSVPLQLVGGNNTFSTFVVDQAGNSSVFTFSITLNQTPPDLAFETPSSGSGSSFSPVDELVSLSEDVTVVSGTQKHNGAVTTWLTTSGSISGGEHTLRLPLSAGSNTFEATIRDSAGNQTSYSGATAFSLSLLSGAPSAPTITSPANGSTAASRTISVSGAAPATGNPATNPVQVRVTAGNTVIGTVSAGAYSVSGVSLQPGANLIRVVALNAVGTASAPATITVTVNAQNRIAIASGDMQVASLGTQAAAPLTVRVTNLAGSPVNGATVTFAVAVQPTAGNATLSSTTVTTNASGLASTTVKVSTNETNAGGFLQATVVQASVSAQYGASAFFSIQGLNSLRFTATGSGPAFVIPMRIDCSTFAPLGECPLGTAGGTVDGFAALVLDASFHLVPNTQVTFSVAAASPGNFGGNSSITVNTGNSGSSFGVAQSGAFTLGQTIGTPTVTSGACSGVCPILLNPTDVSATYVRQHSIQAAAGAILAGAEMTAWAKAGPPASLKDKSTDSNGGPIQGPAEGALIAEVDDAFNNPVANEPVSFQAASVASPDAGPFVFRSDPSQTTAPQCIYQMVEAADSCVSSSLAAITFADGTAYSQMVLGKRSATAYVVNASAGAAPALPFSRSTNTVVVSSPSDAMYTEQISYSTAAPFTIVDTENNDGAPVTGIVWKTTCDVVNNACSGTFTTVRDAGDRIDFSGSSGASFDPLSAAMGNQTSIDGGGRVPVAAPEVASWPVGPPSSALPIGLSSIPVTLSATAATAKGPITVNVPASGNNPGITTTIQLVAPGCSQAPVMTPGVFCRNTPSQPSLPCQPLSGGLDTYIDTTNGYTENNVLQISVQQPGGSPNPSTPIAKFNGSITASGLSFFYDLVPGAHGQPGFYTLAGAPYPSSARLGNGKFAIKFSQADQGCVETVAKSFKRPPAGGIVLPPNAVMSFTLANGGTVAGPELPGGPLQGGQNPHNGWVDEIRRQSGDPATGVAGSDGIPDWIQMHAWDIYQGRTQVPPHKNLVEPDSGDHNLDANEAVVLNGEPADVYSKVALVSWEFDPNAGHGAGTCARGFNTAPGVNGGKCISETAGQPASASGWTVQPEVRFNVVYPELRTDQGWPQVYPDEQGGLNDIVFQAIHGFFHVASHESRHAWQFALLVRTNGVPQTSPQFIPSGIVVKDDEAPGTNLTPDNNDDFRQGDCLPEVAFLGDGRDVGSGTGSAGGILDSPSNREFNASVRGELPGNSGLVDSCARPDLNPIPLEAVQRDAIRFARAVDEKTP